MKRKFNVIAYQSTRHELEVEAETAEEAMDIARGWNPVHPPWRHDPEYFSFDVVDAQPTEEQAMADAAEWYSEDNNFGRDE